MDNHVYTVTTTTPISNIATTKTNSIPWTTSNTSFQLGAVGSSWRTITEAMQSELIKQNLVRGLMDIANILDESATTNISPQTCMSSVGTIIAELADAIRAEKDYISYTVRESE